VSSRQRLPVHLVDNDPVGMVRETSRQGPEGLRHETAAATWQASSPRPTNLCHPRPDAQRLFGAPVVHFRFQVIASAGSGAVRRPAAVAGGFRMVRDEAAGH